MDYVKLSDLVGKTFRVDKVWGYQFQMWDAANKKMLRSDTWQEGYRKTYNLETDQGKLTVSAGQLGQMLEVYVKDGKSDLVGQGISVKSNGKQGMDIRYFFNRGEVQPANDEVAPVPEGDIDMSQVEEMFPG